MKRHETDYFSLAAGLLFTVLGITLAISGATDWTLDGRWLAPLVLIVLGAGGLAASVAATRRERIASAPASSGDWPTDPFA